MTTTPFNRGTVWSDAETARLLALLERGVAHPAIAAELNRDFHDGATVRVSHSISGKVQSLRERGRLPAFTGKIANQHGVSWSAAETDLLVRSRRAGQTFAAIAQLLNDQFHGGATVRTRPQCASRAGIVGAGVTPEQAQEIRHQAAASKGGARSPWRDDEIAVLVKLGARCSWPRLAAEVNKRCHGGVSKRSKGEVAAQVERLRRDGRLTAPGDSAPAPRPQSHPAPAGHPVVPSETDAGSRADPASFFPPIKPRIESAALIGPARECRWIEGTRPYFADGDPYCGAASAPGSSYCAAHHARAYRPPTLSPHESLEAADVA